MYINGFEFTTGMTRQQAIEANSNSSDVGLIFDCIDKDKSGILSNLEISFADTNVTYEENLNPKMKKKIDSLIQKYDKAFETLKEVEEAIRRLISQVSEITDQKEIEKLEKEITKLEKQREKICENLDKYSAKILYLNEVKLDKSLSEKDILQNAQNYMAVRNQMNPYYAKYQEVIAKYNTETDEAKKAEYYAQFRLLDRLCAQWAPSKVDFATNYGQSNISISTSTQTNMSDAITSLTTIGSTKIKNHNLNANASVTRQNNEEDSSNSTNINIGMSDNIEIGENSTLSGSASYNNYNQNSNNTETTNQTLGARVGVTSQIGNANLNGSYSVDYTMSSDKNNDFVQKGSSLTNNINLGLSHQIKSFNYNLGLGITNMNPNNASSTTDYSIPVSANFDLGKGFNINGSFTPTLGDNKSMQYGTGVIYSNNNENISFTNSTNLGYTHNILGDNYSYSNNTQITNNKYGFSASLNLEGSGTNKLSDRYSGRLDFTTPMNDSRTSRLSITAGYDSESKGYGVIGLSFDINPSKKKKM